MSELMLHTKICNVQTYVTYEYEMCYIRTNVKYENVICPNVGFTRKYDVISELTLHTKVCNVRTRI